MANNPSRINPPLAGRPPFATDEPDYVYDNSPSAPTRRLRQPNPQENRPNSAYAVYDNYTNEKDQRQSGYGDLGANLLGGNMDDDSDDETLANHGDVRKDSNEKLPPPPYLSKFPAVPIMAPKPGYAAPVSALTMPEQAASPIGQQRSQQMPRAQGQPQMGQHAILPVTVPGRSPYSAPSVPSTPHPLQAPMTPITPAFARPPKKNEEGGVTFDSESIMRGQREDLPLARRGQKGDDFWRRFSMVVREEGGRKNTSSWLEKTQNNASHLSRMVWLIGILLLIIIGGSIGFGWYVSHNNQTETHAKALGGSAGQGADYTITSSAAAAAATTSGVRPTLTVDKRWPMPEPTPGVLHVVHTHVNPQLAALNSSKRHRRASKRRLA